VALAHAKVNLWLNVVGRRADGYHLLDSLAAFADLADSVEAAPSQRLSVTVAGPQSGALASEGDNLVLKAARLLAERAGVPPRAELSLTKNIPVAAGLGGGSADAAVALRVLSRLWRIELPAEALFELAGRLGADVPMCLAGGAVLASGAGEKLRPAPALPPCGLLLVNPGVPLATRDVFARHGGGFSQAGPIEKPWSDLAGLVEALRMRGNDLTPAAQALQPLVGEVLDRLHRGPGVRYAAMSGSGPTCFGLYDSPDHARQAAKELPDIWWRHAGHFVAH
jgi:4-diphosphocytidyl-2-C-methyl-D-erythritol kinase